MRATDLLKITAIWLLAVSSFAFAQTQPLRRFTVRDSIQLSTFGEEPEILASPDWHYVVVRTTRGVIESGQLESSLWLFDLNVVKDFIHGAQEPPRPELLARMAANANDEPISQIRWAADSQSITFLGRKNREERSLFRLKLEDKQPHELSLPGQDVTDYVANGKILYTAIPVSGSPEDYQSAGPSIPDIQVGTGASLEMLLYPKEAKKSLNLLPQQLWKIDEVKPQAVTNLSSGIPVSLTNAQALSISPDGNYAIATAYVNHVPEEWEMYEPAIAHMKFAADEANSAFRFTTYRPQQYVLINLQTGEINPVLDAPVGWSAGYFEDALKVLWLNGQDEVVLSNTFMPPAKKRVNARYLRPCVAAVDMKTHQAECLLEHASISKNHHSSAGSVVSDLEWDETEQILMVRHGNGDIDEDKAADFFRKDGHSWKKLSSDAEKHSDYWHTAVAEISITVEQGINTPPALVARDKHAEKSRKLWDPNPQLAEIKMGEATVYHWRDAAGRPWTGGLVKPPDYIRGRRYPLVIQTHGFDPNEFLVDGASTGANAARAMAARGMMVLQVREINVAHLTPQEAEIDGRNGYQAAINQLAKEGLINPKQVGIIGWSRTGWYVLNALIHAPRMFAAASLIESTHGDLTQYWWLVDYDLGPVLANSIADGIGGLPAGRGIKKWLAGSPEFNTDKIVAPILFEQNEPSALIFGWDVYAALRSQKKPVELLYIRNGNHNLIKPLERLASQEMNLDWYDFWLNGHEDPVSEKAEQYQRWNKLRSQVERAKNGKIGNRRTSGPSIAH